MGLFCKQLVRQLAISYAVNWLRREFFSHSYRLPLHLRSTFTIQTLRQIVQSVIPNSS